MAKFTRQNRKEVYKKHKPHIDLDRSVTKDKHGTVISQEPKVTKQKQEESKPDFKQWQDTDQNIKAYRSTDIDDIFNQEGLGSLFHERKQNLKGSDMVQKDIDQSANKIGIPHVFHNIYFTSKTDLKEIKEEDIEIIKNNIQKTKLAFPDREYILWVDNESLDCIKGLKNAGVTVKNINDISNNDLETELLNALNKEEFAKASDILRAVLVKEYGGVYLDLDYAIYDYLLLSGLMNTYNLFLGKDSLSMEYFGNAFIAAVPNHPVLIEYVDKIQRNLAVPDSINDPCNAEHHNAPPYIKYPANKFSDTITKTGPAALTIAYYVKANEGNYNNAALEPGIVFLYPGIKRDNLVCMYHYQHDSVFRYLVKEEEIETLSFIYFPENNPDRYSRKAHSDNYHESLDTDVGSLYNHELVLGNDAYTPSWVTEESWLEIRYPACETSTNLEL